LLLLKGNNSELYAGDFGFKEQAFDFAITVLGF